MKSLLKLTLAIATLGSASLFAGGPFRYPENVTPRVLAPPPTNMKCDTMVIQGGGRNGWQTVPCKDYARIRPDDCRRACAGK
jgi:hypothetical protein